MKYDKFFELCKQKGIDEAELYIISSYGVSISLFHSEIDEYKVSDSTSILARGIYKGKMGGSSSNRWEKNTPEKLVNDILTNASLIEVDDPTIIFKGSPKYKRVKTYNKDLNEIDLNTKLDNLFKLEAKIKSLDSRISEVSGVSYKEVKEESTIINSYGLKLNQKSNYYIYSGSAVAKENDQTKSGWDFFFDNDYSKLNIDNIAKSVVKEAVSQLGGYPCETKKYKAVLSNDVVSSLLDFYISNASSESVQKKSSLFIDKLNTKIASKNITILDKPLSNNLLARNFDDEGVATYNKPIIEKGVLKTYLYNLTTAAKDGVSSTGNGFGAGAKKAATSCYLYLKPGKKSQEELFKDVNEGVYITEVSGLHAGMNPQSGNFSLQSSGFYIKNGKIDHALDIITISGNLLEIFSNVKFVGRDMKVYSSGIECPSIEIKKLAVSGK